MQILIGYVAICNNRLPAGISSGLSEELTVLPQQSQGSRYQKERGVVGRNGGVKNGVAGAHPPAPATISHIQQCKNASAVRYYSIYESAPYWKKKKKKK